MIVKHMDNKLEDNAMIFLAQNERGETLLYDYVKEQFVLVDGFSTITPHRCVYDKKSVQRFYTLVEAYEAYSANM